MKFRLAVFILVILVALAAAHLFVYTQNISLKFQISDIKIKLSQVRSQNRSLGAEMATLQNLNRIEKIAKEKLKMIYPEEMNYLLITPEAK